MPSLNAAAQNAMATAAGNLCSGGTLVIYAGATVLATHTMVGFGAPNNGAINANPVANATNEATGEATSARLIEDGREVTLTVGVAGSGAEVIVPSLSYVENGTSTINSVTITYPAS
jgi:hypothetical protein